MASGNKEKISWFARITGRGNPSGYADDLIDDIEFDEMMDDEEGMEIDIEEADLFDIEGEGRKTRVPIKKTGAEDLQINLVDKGNILVAQALVPGIEEDEINIDLNREMLTITTESNEHCVEKEGDYLYEELTFGSFSRSLLLPAEVEVEDSKAEVKDGVLTIVMPKIDKEARKKLSVKRK